MASENRAVFAGLAANAGIAAAKAAAAAFSGSASMAAEAVHSLVDTGDSLLMLWGAHVSKRPPDQRHSFGHGKEIYFWTLVVALMIFAVGGGVTVVEGVERIVSARTSESVGWNFAVLAIAAAFEAYSWSVAFRQLRDANREKSTWEAIRESKDPRAITVLLEDTAAILGLAVAFVGIALGAALDSPYPDGVASILIGGIMAATAVLLARESKALLVGESADEDAVRGVRELVQADGAVERAPQPLTMHLAPDDVLLNLDIQFHQDLSPEDTREALGRLEDGIREKFPEFRRIFVEIGAFDPRRRAARNDGQASREGAGVASEGVAAPHE